MSSLKIIQNQSFVNDSPPSKTNQDFPVKRSKKQDSHHNGTAMLLKILRAGLTRLHPENSTFLPNLRPAVPVHPMQCNAIAPRQSLRPTILLLSAHISFSLKSFHGLTQSFVHYNCRECNKKIGNLLKIYSVSVLSYYKFNNNNWL